MLSLGKMSLVLTLVGCSVPSFETPRDERAPEECRRFADERAVRQLECGAIGWSVDQQHVSAYARCSQVIAILPFPDVDTCIELYASHSCEEIKAGTVDPWCRGFVVAP